MSRPINCSGCHMTLQLPPRATAIRCSNCQSITRSNAPAAIQRPNTAALANGYNNNYMPPLNRQPAPPLGQGRKKAVVIGISYRNSESPLDGCINDAKLMNYLLINKFKFPESSIHMLTDEGTDPNRIPTKRNIRRAMLWLVQGCKAGDSLVFHYSGHGRTLRNHTLDEIDGYDETIVPLDHEKQGLIVDDEINATIVRPIPQGVKLHAIMDCCHSGTVLDLPYLWRKNGGGRYDWDDHRPRSGVWQGTSGGIAISISGCDDHELSKEYNALDNVNQTGVMTYAFTQAIERAQRPLTYGSLITGMRSTIVDVHNQVHDAKLKNKLYKFITGESRVGPPQEVQLCSNERFDVNKRTFSL